MSQNPAWVHPCNAHLYLFDSARLVRTIRRRCGARQVNGYPHTQCVYKPTLTKHAKTWTAVIAIVNGDSVRRMRSTSTMRETLHLLRFGKLETETSFLSSAGIQHSRWR